MSTGPGRAGLVGHFGRLRIHGRLVFRRARTDPALFLGSGQAASVAEWLAVNPVDVVFFDCPIGAVQQRNLNNDWKLPVLDRTELILEIFSRRAQSREGKLQVELAQLEHLSARLVRGWTHLERQRGGIGGRGGPGEKQVELDRRMLRERVKKLRAELEQVRKQRANRRRSRYRSGTFRVSIVGYTNAGKSTLFNRLTNAGTLAADQLFATLDTLTRKLYLEGVGEIMISDTVGFVRDLPHALVDAFKATLEETAEADLLLHVIDASAPDRLDQIAQVQRVLREIGADSLPIIEVYNKIDRQPPGWQPGPGSTVAKGDSPDAVGRCDSIPQVATSAVTGVGLDSLRDQIASIAQRQISTGVSSAKTHDLHSHDTFPSAEHRTDET
ncbi:MAG: GTPase HflX [Burkholderiaceae bacterium]